jgi:hypothetical protein
VFGVIAEDDTDVETIMVLIRRIRSDDSVPWERFVGRGAGRLCTHSGKWARALVHKGCTQLVIVHDSDKHDPDAIRRKVDSQKFPATARHVCVPVREIEAWFFSDAKVLTEVARSPQVAKPNPSSIDDPKSALIRLSRGAGGRARYSTNENARLAGLLDLDACARVCPEFRALREFVRAAP